MNVQLAFELVDVIEAPRTRPRFAKEIPPGAARLVRELVRRGLREDAYVAAAMLALELEREFTGERL